jgi:hypothetical protein
MKRALPLIFVLLFCPLALPAQSVHGRLLDASSGAAIDGATMTLLAEDSVVVQSVLTDPSGEFRLDAPRPGPYRLSAQRIGYRTSATPMFELEERDTLEVEFRLSTEVVLLQPVTVTAYSRRPSGPLSGFYERMERRAAGTFITREQIEQRQPIYPSDLLRTVPGVQLVPTWWGRTVVLMRGRCVPQIFLDGMRIHGGSIDDIVTAMDLEGIEVYRSAVEAPIEFTGAGGGCGAIVLWTRRG